MLLCGRGCISYNSSYRQMAYCPWFLWAYRSVLLNKMSKELSLQFFFCDQDWPENRSHSVLGIPPSSYMYISISWFIWFKKMEERWGAILSPCWSLLLGSSLKPVVSVQFGFLYRQLVSLWNSWGNFASAPKALVFKTNSFPFTGCQHASSCGIVTSETHYQMDSCILYPVELQSLSFISIWKLLDLLKGWGHF